MAENELPSRPKLPLPTIEEIDAFVQEHWINQVCERCGADRWGIHESRPYNFLPATDGEITTQSQHLTSAYAMTCERCGNIRLTLASHLWRWLAERRKNIG